LLTFAIEIAGARRVMLDQVIAILLPRHGMPVEITEPERWLALAAPDRTLGHDGVWHRWFATWLPQRQGDAEAVATAGMQLVATDFASTLQHCAARDRAGRDLWLKLRADDICGPHVPRTADLFGDAPGLPDWQLRPAPLDRLTAFAADSGAAPSRRREANSVVALFRRREEELAAHAALSPPSLRPIGMLLLVPASP